MHRHPKQQQQQQQHQQYKVQKFRRQPQHLLLLLPCKSS
jgi:hypothetical protein